MNTNYDFGGDYIVMILCSGYRWVLDWQLNLLHTCTHNS
jgi:hypothetical protein